MGYKASADAPPHNENGSGVRKYGAEPTNRATAESERATERTLHSKVDVGYGVPGTTGRGAKMPVNAGVYARSKR